MMRHQDVGFKLIFGFAMIFMVGAMIFSAFQYMNAPECNTGVLIQDDAGIYRCVPIDSPVLIRVQNR